MALAFKDYLLVFLSPDPLILVNWRNRRGPPRRVPGIYHQNWDFRFSAEDTFRFRAETDLCFRNVLSTTFSLITILPVLIDEQMFLHLDHYEPLSILQQQQILLPQPTPSQN
ncbi:hypothetical protein B0H16DRAFT_1485405 [Mycena metata]|uniref:Uncharacterized protein n=1 Tax=Mycena metata TaxID=1033252 RepID=A0AAD7GMX2_9AGAR|nr:hypothetical protein B0H16DRAFT_1485405 [Mycena metata]